MTGRQDPYVTPLVRKLAAERGVELASLTGTGAGGRIRAEDVRRAAAARAGAPSVPGGSTTRADAELPPFTASGVDPRELLKLPPLVRAAAAAAPDRATVMAMIASAQAADARGGVVSVGDDTSWINSVWPTS